MIDALLEYRLSHLLGAGGPDAALGLVEFNALRLEWKVAEIEKPAHVCLEVFDHVLVLDPKDLARKRRVPVGHQFDIGTVVSADVLQAVGEFLTRGKQLLEIAEATGHGAAPCIDDPGVRQDQMYQTQVAKIVGHLVDESGLAAAVYGRVDQVFASEPQEILALERLQHRGISRVFVVGFAALQFQHETRNIRKLHRALDLRMRGQYLLEQRRAGSGQPDDEDWRRIRVAHATPGREEFCRAYGFLQPRVALDGLRPVPAL